MQTSPHAKLAAQVAAWHNRHPLARRITAAQVRGEGVVALPFVAQAGKPGRATEVAPAPVPEHTGDPAGPEGVAGRLGLSARLKRLLPLLREKLSALAARASSPALRRAFDDDFLAPLRPSAMARFALRHGTRNRPGPPEWPQRAVHTNAGIDSTTTELRYLRTAAIEVGTSRLRVLIGAGPKPRVLGPRLWSRPRRASAAALLALCVLGPAAWLGGLVPEGMRQTVLAAAGHAASGATPARTAASGVLVGSAVMPASGSASGATPVAASTVASEPMIRAVATSASEPPLLAATASVPLAASAPATDAASGAATRPNGIAAKQTAAAPQEVAASGTAGRPSIRPELAAEIRTAAREESQALRAAQAASDVAAGKTTPGVPDADGKVYAVATPATRTRAGAQLRIVLMNAPVDAEPGRPRAEVLQVGDGWRAVIWPYTDRPSAERVREQLLTRGIPAEVIGF